MFMAFSVSIFKQYNSPKKPSFNDAIVQPFFFKKKRGSDSQYASGCTTPPNTSFIGGWFANADHKLQVQEYREFLTKTHA